MYSCDRTTAQFTRLKHDAQHTTILSYGNAEPKKAAKNKVKQENKKDIDRKVFDRKLEE